MQRGGGDGDAEQHERQRVDFGDRDAGKEEGAAPDRAEQQQLRPGRRAVIVPAGSPLCWRDVAVMECAPAQVDAVASRMRTGMTTRFLRLTQRCRCAGPTLPEALFGARSDFLLARLRSR